jgi:hypothetical protein
VYIRRVIGTGSSESTATAKGGLVTRLLADAPVGNQVRLAALRGIQNGAPSTQLTLTQIKDGATTASGPHTVTVYDSATNIVTLGSPLNSVFEVPVYDGGNELGAAEYVLYWRQQPWNMGQFAGLALLSYVIRPGAGSKNDRARSQF